jgi:hypothetical protein
VTNFEVFSGFPIPAALIAEAAELVEGGMSKRAAGIKIYNRYYASSFEKDDKEQREDRLRHIAKCIRSLNRTE